MTMLNMNSALHYASMGWKVFPLAQGSKVPREGSKGVHDATTDEQQINEWWSREPSANIGIATGKDSDLTVIDVDGDEGMKSFRQVMSQLPKEHTRVIKTPHGHHLYFRYNPSFHTGAGFMTGLDVRSDGGYVVAPPSLVSDTQYYVMPDRYLDPIAITVAPDVFLARSRNGTAPVALETEDPSWVSDLLAHGAVQGQRDQRAASLAGYFHSKGLPGDVIETIMTQFAENCTPPFDMRDLRKVIQSVSRYEVEDKGAVSDQIRQWITETNGTWWTTDELDNQFGIRTVQDKNNRRQILHRLKSEGFIEQHQTINKRFKHRVTQVEGMNYKQAKRGDVFDIRWPLGIEKYVNLYEGNVAVVAGSPNSGKTAMMLNLIHLNQNRIPTYYFCSEMGDSELADRLAFFEQEGMFMSDWDFGAISRAKDFADVIRPDCLNIIDFLELTQDIYLVNQYLTSISHAIGKGVAIVAVQKKIGADLGRGQEFSLEKPRLYLSMDQNKMRILKGKNWARKGYNPNGLSISYRIEDGYKFIPSPEGWIEPN
tara:strand:+ start:914 stop:2533 length:1620 start_codon:yes stop_codon:yes gene_type:complete